MIFWKGFFESDFFERDFFRKGFPAKTLNVPARPHLVACTGVFDLSKQIRTSHNFCDSRRRFDSQPQ